MKLLIADDEKIILEPICDYLKAKGFEVSTAQNGAEAVEMAEENDYDLIILDVMMPVMDGLEACTEIRRHTDTPILFLSALGEERDLLKGYRSGCDDYITKPFPLAVLCEKCLAMIKRYRSINSDNRITVGSVTIDFSAHRVLSGDREIRLSSRDYELLSYLMQNRNIVVSREQILTKIWGYDFDGDIRVVDTHIKRIRSAMGEGSEIIRTIFGVGYIVEEVDIDEKS